jgi:hypothetical protein
MAPTESQTTAIAKKVIYSISIFYTVRTDVHIIWSMATSALKNFKSKTSARKCSLSAEILEEPKMIEYTKIIRRISNN